MGENSCREKCLDKSLKLEKLSRCFWYCFLFLVKFSYLSKFHVNPITGSGVMTILFYKELTRNIRKSEIPLSVFCPHSWGCGGGGEGFLVIKFGKREVHEKLLWNRGLVERGTQIVLLVFLEKSMFSYYCNTFLLFFFCLENIHTCINQ